MSRNIPKECKLNHNVMRKEVEEIIKNKFKKYIIFINVDMFGGDDYYTENSEWNIQVITKVGTKLSIRNKIEKFVKSLVESRKYNLPHGSIIMIYNH